MFKNRALKVTVEKNDKDAPPPHPEAAYEFDRKLNSLFRKFERVGAQMFAGVVVYILLDTYRQVKIVEASKPDQV